MAINAGLAHDAVANLRRAGVVLDVGLSDAEVGAIEERFGFQFAPDHAELLREALPVDGPPVRPGWIGATPRDSWPDWRHGSEADLGARLAAPVEGVLLAVQGPLGFWAPLWGERPQKEGEAQHIAREHLIAWPQLVPVYGHRYLHAAPSSSGSPVLSVHQSDVIQYGDDLATYVRREFGFDPVQCRLTESTHPSSPWHDLATAR